MEAILTKDTLITRLQIAKEGIKDAKERIKYHKNSIDFLKAQLKFFKDEKVKYKQQLKGGYCGEDTSYSQKS